MDYLSRTSVLNWPILVKDYNNSYYLNFLCFHWFHMWSGEPVRRKSSTSWEFQMHWHLRCIHHHNAANSITEFRESKTRCLFSAGWIFSFSVPLFWWHMVCMYLYLNKSWCSCNSCSWCTIRADELFACIRTLFNHMCVGLGGVGGMPCMWFPQVLSFILHLPLGIQTIDNAFAITNFMSKFIHRETGHWLASYGRGRVEA